MPDPTPLHMPTISFRDGFKYVDGVRVESVGYREFLSSNGVTKYTAVAWADGQNSCNCTGWATSKKQPKACKHSQQVRPGDAQRLAAHAAYGGVEHSQAPRVEAAPKKGRKIILD